MEIFQPADPETFHQKEPITSRIWMCIYTYICIHGYMMGRKINHTKNTKQKSRRTQERVQKATNQSKKQTKYQIVFHSHDLPKFPYHFPPVNVPSLTSQRFDVRLLDVNPWPARYVKPFRTPPTPPNDPRWTWRNGRKTQQKTWGHTKHPNKKHILAEKHRLKSVFKTQFPFRMSLVLQLSFKVVVGIFWMQRKMQTSWWESHGGSSNISFCETKQLLTF